MLLLVSPELIRRPPIGPVSTGDKSNPLYVSVVTSASSFLWKLFLWLFILGIFFTWQFSKYAVPIHSVLVFTI